MSGNGPVSAADVSAEKERRLREDPEYRAAVEQAASQRAALANQRRIAARPVVDDLRAAGIDLESVSDLYKSPESYPIAIPILLEHLARAYPERVLLYIGSALPNKPPKEWWPTFKRLYLATQSPAVRDRLAASMSACAVREHYPELLEFVNNSDLGESRIYFLRPINRIGNRIAKGQGRAVIAELADDPELGKEATAILKGRGVNQ